MDMLSYVVELVQQVGFPIFVAVVLLWRWERAFGRIAEELRLLRMEIALALGGRK